jgi:hypothetical protein
MPTITQIDAMILRAYRRLCETRRDRPRTSMAILKHQEAAVDALLDQRLAMMEKRQ